MKQIKLLCLLMTAVILLSSCIFTLPDGDDLSRLPSQSNTSSLGANAGADDADRKYFKDIKYVRPDFAEIDDLHDTVSAMLTAGATGEQIKEKFEEYCDKLDLADSMLSLISVQQSINATDDKITSELNEVDGLLNAAYEKYVLLCKNISETTFRDEVLYDWDEDDFEQLKLKSAYMDSEFTALNSKQTELENEYISRMSSMTFEYRGKEYSFDELNYIEGIPQKEYERIANEYEAALESIGELYINLVNVNKEIAKKAGYRNFSDFCYESTYYRDYTPAEAAELHKTVKQVVAPMISDLMEKHISKEEMKEISRYYYKDNMLKSNRNIIEGYLKEMDMYDVFAAMEKYGYCYIGDDSRMQDGAYTTYIYSYDMPFIYICQNGGYLDMMTLIHEFGHFYPEYTLKDECADVIDICEIQSQANEFLFLKHFEALGKNACSGITKFQLVDALYSLCYGCMYDEFQQKVYSGDYKTARDINDMYIKLCDEYCLDTSDFAWVEVGHNFNAPLYYISYAVSVVPALEIYTVSTEDRGRAIEIYHELSRIEAGTDFSEALSQIGLSNPFDPNTINNLCKQIQKQFY